MTPNDRPFDLGKLDFEGKRKRLRKQLLRYFAVPFVIIALIALKLIFMLGFHHFGIQNYQSGAYDGAARMFGNNAIINVIEPYRTPYAIGTSYLQSKQYTQASSNLYKALEYMPPKSEECQIRTNLVLSLIGEADSMAAQQRYQESIVIYDKARAVIDARDCGLSGGDAGVSSETKQANDDLQELSESIASKQNDVKKESNGDGKSSSSDSNESSKNNQSDQASQSQLDKLKDQNNDNSQSARERTESGRAASESDSADRDFDAKNW